jgi:hypothetical protein
MPQDNRSRHGSVSGSGGVRLSAAGSSTGRAEPARKRRVGSGTSADSETSSDHFSVAGSSTGRANQLLRQPVTPVKKRRVDTGASTDSETSSDDGSQHSIDSTRLFFTDVGFVENKLQGEIIEDSRHCPDKMTNDDINELVSEVRPDIYVKPHRVRTRETEWDLVAPDWQEVTSDQYIPLQNTPYDGCLMTLRRSTPREISLKIFNVRIPECKSSSSYYVKPQKRPDMACTIFTLLNKEKAPCIVIGNLGFALATCLRGLQQFDEKMVRGFQISYR